MSKRRAEVLVTGAAGFIGSHVCDRLLKEDSRVVGVDDMSTGRIGNLQEAYRHEDFAFEITDIREDAIGDVISRYRPDTILHLAAQPHVNASARDPRHDADVNILGTINLARHAVKYGVRRIVYAASGGTVYGEQELFPVYETAAAESRPLSPYGLSKKVAGDYLALFGRLKNLQHVQLALGNVYGPRQDPDGEAGVIAIFAERLLDGEACTIRGDGSQTRDFVYVGDVADAIVLAIDRGESELINVGTGKETSILELHEAVARAVGRRSEPEFVPLPPGEARRSALHVGKARDLLGWEPLVPLEEGLTRTVDYLR